jgi:hypothetical protein
VARAAAARLLLLQQLWQLLRQDVAERLLAADDHAVHALHELRPVRANVAVPLRKGVRQLAQPLQRRVVRLRVGVHEDGAAAQPAHGGREHRLQHQLERQLRLAGARGARDLDETARVDAAAQRRVENWAASRQLARVSRVVQEHGRRRAGMN